MEAIILGDRIMVFRVEYDIKKKAYIKGDAQWLEVGKILNTRVERIKGDDRIIITSTDGIFFYNNLVDNFTLLMSELENFEKADRGVVINLSHDVSLDIDKRIVIFDQFPEITSTVGLSRIDNIKNLIKKWILNR